MARKPNNPPTEVVIENDIIKHADAIEETNNAMATHSAEIMEKLGDGLPYEKHRIINETRFYMAQSAEAMLEAGKRLVILKEHEPHGDFETILRNQIGIPERTAQRLMQCAIKYLSPKLQAKAPALALLDKTKLFELVTEDDDDLAALAEGGTIAGLTLDDIDRMSSRELRKALRESKEELQAKEDVLADKNKQIDNLQEKFSRIKKMPLDEQEKTLRSECNSLCDDADHLVRTSVRSALISVLEFGEATDDGDGQEARKAWVRDRIRTLEEAIALLRHDTGIDGLEWEA